MNILKTIKEQGVNRETASAAASVYKQRNAARAVVFDNDGNIALLYVSKKDYHKLPGGGVEEGESVTEALKRECLEEIGCHIDIGEEVGEIVEYRDRFKLKQHSLCYIARVSGDKGKPDYTNEEVRDGFALLWMPIDKAISLLSQDSPHDYEGKFIVPRDLVFLKRAREHV